MEYIWIILMILALMCCAVMGLYLYVLKKRIVYYRNVLINMTTGTLMSESLTTVAEGYGLQVGELMTIIETYQNTTGEKRR